MQSSGILVRKGLYGAVLCSASFVTLGNAMLLPVLVLIPLFYMCAVEQH